MMPLLMSIPAFSELAALLMNLPAFAALPSDFRDLRLLLLDLPVGFTKPTQNHHFQIVSDSEPHFPNRFRLGATKHHIQFETLS